MSKLELQAEQCRFPQTAIISHVVLKLTNKSWKYFDVSKFYFWIHPCIDNSTLKFTSGQYSTLDGKCWPSLKNNIYGFLMWMKNTVCFFFFFYWWAVTHPSIPIEPWAPLSICFIRPCDKGSRTHRIKGFKNLKSFGPKIFLESADINSFHMPDFSLKSSNGLTITKILLCQYAIPLILKFNFVLVNSGESGKEMWWKMFTNDMKLVIVDRSSFVPEENLDTKFYWNNDKLKYFCRLTIWSSIE